jgi:hypothetical protein
MLRYTYSACLVQLRYASETHTRNLVPCGSHARTNVIGLCMAHFWLLVVVSHTSSTTGLLTHTKKDLLPNIYGDQIINLLCGLFAHSMWSIMIIITGTLQRQSLLKEQLIYRKEIIWRAGSDISRQELETVLYFHQVSCVSEKRRKSFPTPALTWGKSYNTVKFLMVPLLTLHPDPFACRQVAQAIPAIPVGQGVRNYAF